jgi:hypothetical protein
MAKVKLVAESFQEYNSSGKAGKLNEQELNESSKASLEKFLKDPEKNKKSFLSAYAAQIGKKGGDKLKNALAKLPTEDQKKLAQQSMDALADAKKGYAWVKIKDGKIVGATALGQEGRSGVMGVLGGS